jgi:hypothetical protein
VVGDLADSLSGQVGRDKQGSPDGMDVQAMARLAVITIPKWAMSILKTWASGMNKGAVSSMAGRGSMNVPSRSKAILQQEEYHRNPLEAGLAETLHEYPWTSHQGYLSRNPRWEWLFKDIVLEMLAAHPPEKIETCRRFVIREDSKELVELFSRKRWPAFWGRISLSPGWGGGFSRRRPIQRLRSARI